MKTGSLSDKVSEQSVAGPPVVVELEPPLQPREFSGRRLGSVLVAIAWRG